MFSATAEAHGWDAAGTEVVDQDPHHYVGATATPAIDIEALVEAGPLVIEWAKRPTMA